jgi:hypothetical protein
MGSSAADHDDTGRPGWVTPLLLLAVGVAVSGVADFALTRAGYGNLATLAWAMGYAGTLIVLWLVWGQHLEFVGNTGIGHDADADERTHAAPDDDPATETGRDRGDEPPESY